MLLLAQMSNNFIIFMILQLYSLTLMERLVFET